MRRKTDTDEKAYLGRSRFSILRFYFVIFLLQNLYIYTFSDTSRATCQTSLRVDPDTIADVATPYACGFWGKSFINRKKISNFEAKFVTIGKYERRNKGQRDF